MSTLLKRVIRALLPRGAAWEWRGDGDRLIDGLSQEPGRLHGFLRGVIDESFPGTATETVPEWYTMFGLPYDPTLTLQTHRARLESVETAIGAQDLEYLESVIHREMPNITLREVRYNFETMAGAAVCGQAVCDQNASTDGTTYTPHEFFVEGTVANSGHLQRLIAIIERTAPLHLEPTYNVTNLAAEDIAVCGLGVCGNAETGKSAA